MPALVALSLPAIGFSGLGLTLPANGTSAEYPLCQRRLGEAVNEA